MPGVKEGAENEKLKEKKQTRLTAQTVQKGDDIQEDTGRDCKERLKREISIRKRERGSGCIQAGWMTS